MVYVWLTMKYSETMTEDGVVKWNFEYDKQYFT